MTESRATFVLKIATGIYVQKFCLRTSTAQFYNSLLILSIKNCRLKRVVKYEKPNLSHIFHCRCITLSEPTRTDYKSAESWGLVVGRMRQLLLQSFNTNLGKFEEYMRNQRERRQEAGWSFFQYFLLQVQCVAE